MNIKGKVVTLRAIEKEDLPLLHKWANEPYINSMIGGWHFPSSIKDQEKWFDSLHLNSLHQRFAIDVPELGLIGTANLVDINWKDGNAHHGMLLGDSAIRGKGYAKDTIMSIMRYSFEELGLFRLDSTIIEYNKPSQAVYLKKCGWKEEGVQRGWYFRSNQRWDRILIGITKQDYSDLIKENNYWEDK